MRALLTISMILITACGITKPRYVKYGQPETTGTAGKSCAAAQEAFKSQIQSASDGACQLCHGPGAQAAATLTFVKGDVDASAASFKKTRFGTDPAKIWAYISSSSHAGFTYAKEALSESKIKTWLDAEATCQ